MNKHIFTILYIVLLISVANSQNKTELDSTKNKPSAKDTSGIKKDTSQKYVPIKKLDQIKSDSDSSNFLYNKEIQSLDYFNSTDIFSNLKGISPFDFGNPGQPNPISFEGLDWRHISLFVDGFLIGNSVFGVPDQLLIMTEDISSIEIIPSSESFLFGKSGSSKSINIITNKYNPSSPHTHLRHIEAPYETYLTDGIFSQNITKNSNIMVGFNYQISTGRYSNSNYNFFNVRTKYRLNISNNLNLLITDHFYKYERGLNGGAVKYDTNNVSLDIYKDKLTTVKYLYANEKNSRNDLNITIGGRFFNDSLDVTQLKLSIISEKRDFSNSGTSSLQNTLTKYTAPSNTITSHLELKQNYIYLINNFSTCLGYDYLKVNEFIYYPFPNIEERTENINYSNLWASFYDNLNYFDVIKINIFARYDIYSGNSILKKKNNLSYGLNANYHLLDITPYIEFSNYYRTPNPSEEFAGLLEEIRSEKHTYFSIGSKYENKILNLNLNLFYRKIGSPFYLQKGSLRFLNDIEKYNYSSEQVMSGLDLKVTAKVGKIIFNMNTTYLNNKLDNQKLLLFPELSSSFGIYYQDTIITNNINLKLGVNGRLFSKYDGFFFYPDIYGLLPFFSDYEHPEVPSSASFNLFAVLKIEDASIYLTLENIFDKKYYTVPYYPLNDRSFKLAVSWTFSD